MKAIIDTCVIIDVLQARKPFCETSQKIFLGAATEQYAGCITAKSVADIYYLTHRLTHSDKETRNIISKLFVLFRLTDTTSSDCLHALLSPVSDFEDAIMIETAKRVKADCIITRNINDFRDSEISVYTPEEFLEVLQNT